MIHQFTNISQVLAHFHHLCIVGQWTQKEINIKWKTQKILFSYVSKWYMFNFLFKHTHNAQKYLIFHKSIILFYMQSCPGIVLSVGLNWPLVLLMSVSACFVICFSHLLTGPLSGPGHLSWRTAPLSPPWTPVSLATYSDYTDWQVHIPV